MFHVAELEIFLFYEDRSNSKIALIKTKGIVIYHGNNNGGIVTKGQGNIQWPKNIGNHH